MLEASCECVCVCARERAYMCVFVTISEKRGIVYTEHMLVAATKTRGVWGRGSERRRRGYLNVADTDQRCISEHFFGEAVKPQM